MQAESYTQHGIRSKTVQKRKLNMVLKNLNVMTNLLRVTKSVEYQLGEIQWDDV